MPGHYDVFYRRWMKALPEDLDDPRLYRLPLECRGVFALACLFSLKTSNTPGRFESQAFDGPMSLQDIAEGIRVDVGTVESAFSRLRQTTPPLMTFEDDEWSIPNVEWERRSHQGELAKIRAANRDRQERYRKRNSRKNKKPAAPVRLREVAQ